MSGCDAVSFSHRSDKSNRREEGFALVQFEETVCYGVVGMAQLQEPSQKASEQREKPGRMLLIGQSMMDLVQRCLE